MDDTKKSADALDKQSANNTSSNKNVAQNKPNVKRRAKDGKPSLVMQSDARTLSIKCYEEQLPFVTGDLREDLRARISAIPKERFWIIAIVHDRDPEEDDIWGAAIKKKHVHIYAKAVNPAHARVSTYMNTLGVVYRPGVDDALWKEHGVETCDDYSTCAMYATHESESAVKKGKVVYDFEEIISNLSDDEVRAIRAGYKALHVAKRLSAGEWEDLKSFVCHMAIKTESFEEWYNNQPLIVQSNSKMKTLEKMYSNTLDALMRGEPLPACLGEMADFTEDQRKELRKTTRLCVFIHGEGNLGKTYAAEAALSGKRKLKIAGGGSGRFDKLNVSIEAMILDDDVCPSLLLACDDYKTQLYGRGTGGNRYWCGRYFIVTSNLSFEEWAKTSGMITRTETGEETASYKALRSRFYICDIRKGNDDKNGLYVKSYAVRGTQEELEERYEMFKEFRDKFDATMATYQPQSRDFSIYDGINDRRYGRGSVTTAAAPGAGTLPTDGDGFIQVSLENLDEELPFT